MSSMPSPFSLRSLGWLLVAAVPVVLVSALGSLFTFQGLVSWYPALKKPFFTPPNQVFPVVWTFLYAVMALACWRILRAPAQEETKPLKRKALMLYGAQLVLNLGWSYAFFALRSPWAGVAVIVPLIGLIALTIRAFRPLDRAAANVLYLYLSWVSFAGLLNLSIALLN